MNIQSTIARRLYATQAVAGVAVPASGNTDIVEFDVTQISRLALELINGGANALDAFIIQGKVNPAGNYVTLLSAASDYTSPAGIVVDASGDLTVLAGGATGWLILDVLAFAKIRVQASANVSGATTLSVNAGGS